MPVTGRAEVSINPPLLLEKLPETSWVPDGLQIDTVPLLNVLSERAIDIRPPAVPSNSRRATFSAGISTVFDSPSENRPVEPTFDVAVPLGGMKRSGPVLDPAGVATETWPPSVAEGTLNLIVPEEVEITSGLARLRVTTSEEATGSKFEPEIVISSPAAASDAEREVMWGVEDSATVKLCELVTGPSPGVETVTDPEVAPLGTLAVKEVAVAALTVATVPLNLTVSELGVVEKPVPSIVTVAPTSPPTGLIWTIDRVDEAWREIERRFPVASQP